MAARNTRRITKSVVDGLEPNSVVWDSVVAGFGVRRQRSARVFFLKCIDRRRQRWLTIGRHGSPWTVETARKEAQRRLGLICSGQDPAGNGSGQTVVELAVKYLRDHAAHHKKASSALNDHQNIQNHILPLLGKVRVVDVSATDVERFKTAVREGQTASPNPQDLLIQQRGGSVVRGGPGAANRCLSLLSKMFNLAERWGLRPANTNPVRGVMRFREHGKGHFLTDDEYARLAASLGAAEKAGKVSTFVAASIRLLALTGARRSEILNLRWSDVDLAKGLARLPDSKTGPKSLRLSSPALQILAKLPRLASNPFVIAGALEGQHLVNLEKPWRRIRTLANLEHVRLHDLRHSFASVAAESGQPLMTIGKLLGHAKTVTTERYAKLSYDYLHHANEQIGLALSSRLSQ